MGYRASPFLQLLNIRGSGRTIFGNNLALQGSSGSGTGLVISGGHVVELWGNLFGGWSALLSIDGREIASPTMLENGRIEGVSAGENGALELDFSVGRDGVPYRLTADSPAIDAGVTIPESEAVLFDIDGQPRPAPVAPDASFSRDYEGRPDVGADEYYR